MCRRESSWSGTSSRFEAVGRIENFKDAHLEPETRRQTQPRGHAKIHRMIDQQNNSRHEGDFVALPSWTTEERRCGISIAKIARRDKCGSGVGSIRAKGSIGRRDRWRAGEGN